jgi:hypothetical protein
VHEDEIPQTNVVPSIEIRTEEELLTQSPSIEKQSEEEVHVRPSTPPLPIVEEQIHVRPPTSPPVIEAPPVEEAKVQSTTSTSLVEKQPPQEIKVCLTFITITS